MIEMKKIIFIICLFSVNLLHSQQLPMYSQYLTNDFAINPAVAGTKPYFPLQLNVRRQWTALGDIAPQTNTLSYHMPMSYDQIGLGAIVIQDQTGPYSQLGFQLSFAYHIQLNQDDDTRLSLGLSGLLTQHNLNANQLEFHNPDPQFEGLSYIEMVPDASVGAYLYGESYFLSLSAHQLFESTFKESISNIFGDNTQVRHYFANAGFTYEVHSDFLIEPSILVKAIEAGPVQFDINTRFIINKSFYTGLSLRSSKSVVVLGGLKMGSLVLSYSYDYGLSSLSTAASGSHEITLGFNINDKRKRRHSYYW